ncbi:MAG: M20 family metallopeptidase [Desulfobacterales bacterium]|nr:M20 family metallopeptidase [Desulfobacterales bacterium]
MMFSQIKQQITEQATKHEQTIWDSAVYIHENPELGLAEYKASTYLTDLLEEHGFVVERGAAGLETAFHATFALNADPSPCVAFIAEYDALPELGHACGHNLIGAAGVGAAIVLSKIKALKGRIVVLGTPAEETVGGKIPFVKKGYLTDVDAAMMVHPSERHEVRGQSRSCIAVNVEFRGRPAHAAGRPHDGINALDAMIQLFTNIGLLRQQLHDDVRIHGFISHGGAASNIIPDYTRAEFLVRAMNSERTYDTLERFKNCVRAAALATGASETIIPDLAHVFEPLKTNSVIMERYIQNMKGLGVMVQPQDPLRVGGSTDMGNISQAVPGIHPRLGIAEPDQKLVGHSPEFTTAARSEQARVALSQGVTALALCGADLLSDPEILSAAKAEFEKTT